MFTLRSSKLFFAILRLIKFNITLSNYIIYLFSSLSCIKGLKWGPIKRRKYYIQILNNFTSDISSMFTRAILTLSPQKPLCHCQNLCSEHLSLSLFPSPKFSKNKENLLHLWKGLNNSTQLTYLYKLVPLQLSIWT